MEKKFKDDQKLKKITGDIRDKNLLRKVLQNQDIVIHLACISNDPSYELNPSLGKSINFDAFEPLVKISKENKVKKLFMHPPHLFMELKKKKM